MKVRLEARGLIHRVSKHPTIVELVPLLNLNKVKIKTRDVLHLASSGKIDRINLRRACSTWATELTLPSPLSN